MLFIFKAVTGRAISGKCCPHWVIRTPLKLSNNVEFS